ncbi:MAG TPA: DUF4040 domain-containing protein [Nocardioidaceae bacterium]|nr:DUF4040 domain-containing protein [Nocardioidaceae bacterium]
MSVVVAVVLLGCAALGTVVVLVRDPLRQAMVASGYGAALVAVFVVLRAPDVALSAIVVVGAASPLLTLLALSRISLDAGDEDDAADDEAVG